VNLSHFDVACLVGDRRMLPQPGTTYSCISCVHFLRRRARDQQATVMRQTLRGAAESVRGQVMARGWHQRPVIGPALQWLNRHLPW
jgi:hypothetical protein